jgi:hypothetical protein
MSDIELPPAVLGDDDLLDDAQLPPLPDDEPELPPPVDSDDQVSLPSPVESDKEDHEVQDLPPPPSVGGHCNCKRKRCNFMFDPTFIETMRKEQKSQETKQRTNNEHTKTTNHCAAGTNHTKTTNNENTKQ